LTAGDDNHLASSVVDLNRACANTRPLKRLERSGDLRERESGRARHQLAASIFGASCSPFGDLVMSLLFMLFSM
jgi:hypothetical protein